MVPVKRIRRRGRNTARGRFRVAIHRTTQRQRPISRIERSSNGNSSLWLSPLPTEAARGVQSALDGGYLAAGKTRLLAGESQRRGIASLKAAQSRLFTCDVIPRRRQEIFAFGHLDLEHDHVALAERHFRAGEIEFP